MVSTARAVALASLANQGKIGIEDLKRYYPHVKEMDLFGKAHFLMAAIGVKGTEVMRKEIFNMILVHVDQTGGKFVCNEVFDDSYSRILASPLRTNAAVLSSLIAYGKTEEGKEYSMSLKKRGKLISSIVTVFSAFKSFLICAHSKQRSSSLSPALTSKPSRDSVVRTESISWGDVTENLNKDMISPESQ